MVILALGLVLLMIKLGFWQLSRADEKIVIQQQLTQRLSQSSLTYEQALQIDPINLTGYKLKLYATPMQGHLFLLDNQTHNGVVGYLAFQVISISNQHPSLLVELGFVPAPTLRSELPKISLLQQAQMFSGRLYQKSANPMSYQLHAEPGYPTRIQNLNISAMSSLIGKELFPAVLQAKDLNNGLDHPWVPIPMPAQKHQGYAFQWFSMALALAILIIIAYLKFTRLEPSGRQRSENEQG